MILSKKFVRDSLLAFWIVGFFVGTQVAQATIETAFITNEAVLSLNEPDKNSACTMYGDIGSWSAYGGNAYRYIAKIDLSKITADPAQILKATFNIDRVSNSWDDNNNYVLQRVTTPWSVGAVTWGNQPSKDPGTISPSGPVYGMFRFDITQIVKNWLSNPASNYGVIIKKVNEDTTLEKNKGLFACASYGSGGSESVPTITVESCNEDEWTCGGWNNCSQAGTQTRSCSKSVDCPNIDTPASPETTQSCTPPPTPVVPNDPPVPRPNSPTPPSSCNSDSWICSEWSACSSGGRQTRNCSKIFDCSTVETPSPEVSQTCQSLSAPPPTACTSDTWGCSDWSACSESGRQTRVCNKTFDCSTVETPSPEVNQTCQPLIAPPPAPAPNEQTCTADTWACGEWGICSLSGIQGRTCNRTFNCPNAETPPPATDQYCEAPVQPQPVTPGSPNAAVNQDTIIKATVKLVCPIDELMASQGSGTIINQSGAILTNRHVINQTAGCFVGFINKYSDEPYFDQRQIADIINISPDQDIAILKLRNPLNNSLPYINITTGQSSNLTLGSKITTYGYPARFGTTLTYTSGDFSGTVPGFLKTTAIIEHGNSGGGAYLYDGTFVGMPTAVIKGELNALGYILAVDNINSWLNNKPLAYNPNTDNNYSRVRRILESYSTKKLPALRLAIPIKKSNPGGKSNKLSVVPDKVEPIKQAAEEKKVQAEKFKELKNNQADNKNAAQALPPEPWFKRLIRWIKNFF